MDDKWSIGHKCKRKELSVLISQEGDGDYNLAEEEFTQFDHNPPDSPNLPPTEPFNHEIFLNLVMGISSPKTLKLEGTIQRERVIVMIDLGANTQFYFIGDHPFHQALENIWDIPWNKGCGPRRGRMFRS